MTAPGELSYWIADCWSDDPAKDKLEARIDQAFERIYDALPSRINLLDQADQREAHLVLLMVAALVPAKETVLGALICVSLLQIGAIIGDMQERLQPDVSFGYS